MAGTKAGGKAAAATIKKKYGDDYYVTIGKKGGALGRTGGFHYLKKHGQGHLVRQAGRQGGIISRRKSKKGLTNDGN